MPRRCHRPLATLVVLAIALFGNVAVAATVSVLGVPHLRHLQPAATAEQHQPVLQKLRAFAPTLVCVEAMPGERVEAFAADPARYGELLQTFGLDAVRLASEQQVRLRLSAAAARDAARELVAKPVLDDAAALRLIGLQLAAHDPWSATLNWTRLQATARASAAVALGTLAPGRLDEMAASPNEISALAIPLARALGHRRLCTVDAFVDELTVATLAADLMPLLQQPGVTDAVQAWQAEAARRWQAGDDDGLLRLLRWYNSNAFAEGDAAAQWNLFDQRGHGAGSRRLMLWHARNADITSHVFRASAQPDGGRVLLVIGAAHRPFIERALRAQPWTRVIEARELLD